ncbi:hypothetical protein CDIK_1158 [Cucumispora dikerogammari]|nr:hypothetical protein CDIK_1158 [Cucumispora dikerogammari]
MHFLVFLHSPISAEHIQLAPGESIEIEDSTSPNKPYKCSVSSSSYHRFQTEIYHNNILMEASKEESVSITFYPEAGEIRIFLLNTNKENIVLMIKTSTTEKISQIGESENGDELTRELESSLRMTINAQSEELSKLTLMRQKINRMKNFIKLFMVCEFLACVSLIVLMNRSNKEIIMKK